MASKALRPSQLRHLQLPGLTSYHHASQIQDHIVRQFLNHKAQVSSNPSSSAPAPLPTVLTFTPRPIYTTGRRELHTPISAAQLKLLTTPLSTPVNLRSSFNEKEEKWHSTAEVHQATRGGQITFHGPGQLVIYPLLDLKPFNLSPRCYVNLLEATTISTLSHYNISSTRTSDPGVWLDMDGAPPSGILYRDMKIAALGVHLRRNVTSHGVGLNVFTDLRWFDRIVACGLEGKAVSSMQALGVEVSVAEVASVWMKALAEGLGIGKDGILQGYVGDVEAEMASLSEDREDQVS